VALDDSPAIGPSPIRAISFSLRKESKFSFEGDYDERAEEYGSADFGFYLW
jgi:hypothetical protein